MSKSRRVECQNGFDCAVDSSSRQSTTDVLETNLQTLREDRDDEAIFSA